jgi:hypothetical protein
LSKYLDFRRGRVACIAIAVCLVFAAVPIAAQASPVGLGTAQPFVVLSGAGVTNSGPSVLNGDLGVSPGSSLTGFGLPTVVNGATHAGEAVAAQAQSDLTTAYNVAAGQPVAPGDELTGIDLGGLTLGPGAYGYSTSAQLTGQLTLDAHGDPNAQFVFVIGTTLTTATASSVILTDGASPCNVYWKIGSSATLGTSTAFEGNILALTTISLGENATVLGRLLARNGEVTLIEDVLTAPQCATAGTPSPTGSDSEGTPTTTTPGTTTTGATPVLANGGKAGKKGGKGKTPGKTPTAAAGKATVSRGPRGSTGVTVTVNGKKIGKVSATDNGTPVPATGPKGPIHVTGTPGVNRVRIHVTFTDRTKPKTFNFAFRMPTPILHPHTGPSQFTG